MSSLHASKCLERGGILRIWDLKEEVVAQCCRLSGAKETLESCERHADLPSACEESLSTPLVNVWVTGESWEGQVVLQRDLQR